MNIPNPVSGEKRNYYTIALAIVLGIIIVLVLAQVVMRTDTETPVDIPVVNDTVRVPFSRMVYTKGIDTYSATSDGQNELNLSKIFNVVYDFDSQIIANEPGDKVAFVNKTDENISLLTAHSDGTKSQSIFSIDRTWCDVLRLSRFSDSGELVVFTYGPSEEGDGPACQPKRPPSLAYGTYYYKHGQGVQPVAMDIGGAAAEFIGFTDDNQLFWVSGTQGDTKSVWN